MAQRDRFKRQLLREVVRENVETIQGRPPPALRRSWRTRRAVLRGLRVVALPTLIFGSIAGLAIAERERGLPREPVAAAVQPTPTSFPVPQRFNPAAFPLEVKKIVLDPGHGGKDPGAPTPFGLWEKDITLDVAYRLRILLREASFDVVMTRERDETVSLQRRARFANAVSGDLFVSIHFNSLPTRGYRGVETYYLGPTDDPAIEQLAGVENRGSGYSLADFRRLLEGVYTHARQRESRALAETIHRQFVLSLVRVNPGLRDNGVKAAPFLVLVATDMPGILAEASVLSNTQEARLVARSAYRQQIARALFEGIRTYAEARNQPRSEGSL